MEDLQSILEKINREGVEKAEAEAARIVSAAKEKAAAIVREANTPVQKLHSAKIRLVCAGFQAAAAKLLAEHLTEEESAVYRRGRNAGGTPSKNADPAEYRQATGLEAVFGYLQLMGQTERIETLFRIIWENRESLLHNA